MVAVFYVFVTFMDKRIRIDEKIDNKQAGLRDGRGCVKATYFFQYEY